ncbi:MAG: hypothetical protein IH965_04660 [Gemmatimonadetes bacterium]|nr:hypothetical protein [Gemmatimonadota bacterium]
MRTSVRNLGTRAIIVASVGIFASCEGTTAPETIPDLTGKYSYVLFNPCAFFRSSGNGAIGCQRQQVFVGGISISRQVGDSIYGDYTDHRGVFPLSGQIDGTVVNFKIAGLILRLDHEGTVRDGHITGRSDVFFSAQNAFSGSFTMTRVID